MRCYIITGGLLAAMLPSACDAVELGIDGTRFTLDGEEAFLLGVSYYGALGAPEETVVSDLDALRDAGVNWIRVWATWGFGGENVSAVDGKGEARQPYLDRLVRLVDLCDERGIVVDVTFSRGNGVVAADDGITTCEDHLRAAETVARALLGKGNAYIDMGNERNIGDDRHVPFEDLGIIRDAIKAFDPDRLVTASHAGGDMPAEDFEAYVKVARVDFITPHRPRNAQSPGETAEKTGWYMEQLGKAGRLMPVHYQEPFRRDFSPWQPKAEDFLTDLAGAVKGGAAGWCLHNGSPRRDYEGPSRSFDLRPGQPTLMEQLDEEELEVIAKMASVAAEAAE